MPVAIPDFDIFGVKIVTRLPDRHPSVQGNIFLYSLSTGELKAVMDGTLITEWRTGAVAAHSIHLFQRNGANIFSFLGLGETARKTLTCYLAAFPNQKPKVIKLLRYKDQAERFAYEYAMSGIEFEIVDTIESLICGSDVIVSCVTAFDGPIAKDSWFKRGCLVVPVHTRGFQNCDLFFEKVFADDKGHVSGFKYFDRFHSFAEVALVLDGEVGGRISDNERILVYNIGIGLHDIFFANQIYKKIDQTNNIYLGRS